jgi:hypothetical protein
MDVRFIGPVTSRRTQKAATNIVAESPQLFVLGHTNTPSGNLSRDHIDLCTSELAAATFKLRSELCRGPLADQIRDLRLDGEQVKVLLPVSAVAVTIQPSVGC